MLKLHNTRYSSGLKIYENREYSLIIHFFWKPSYAQFQLDFIVPESVYLITLNPTNGRLERIISG